MQFRQILYLGTLLVVVFTGVGMAEAETLRNDYSEARQLSREGEYGQARSLLSQILDRSDIPLSLRFDSLSLKASTYVRENNRDAAHALYPELRQVFQQMLTSDQTTKAERLSAGLAVVDTLLEAGKYDQAGELCQTLLELEGVDMKDRLRIQYALADVDIQKGHLEAAEEKYRQALTFDGLASASIMQVYGRLATLHRRQVRDPDKLKAIIEELVAFEPVSTSTKRWLKILAKFEGPLTSYNDPANVEFAWENFLLQEGLSQQERDEAHFGLIEAKLHLRKLDEAREHARQLQDNEMVSSGTRLFGALTAMGLDAIEHKSVIEASSVDQVLAEADAVTPAERFEALNEAAACLKLFGNGEIARQFSVTAQEMVEQPERSYLSRYVEEAPAGAGGWFASGLLDDPDQMANDFLDYNVDHAKTLVTDVAAERAAESGPENEKQFYFENTAFSMVHDLEGWHIFVLCGEKDLQQKRNRGDSLGALEFFFAPSPERAYYQWIVSLDSGEVDFYNWNSPNQNYRTPEQYAEVETVDVGDEIGVYIFFPWDMLYDKLPFDSNEEWLFQLMRWSPAGGLAWTGGKVHATGDFGRIEWATPPPEDMLELRKHLLVTAWTNYQETRAELIDDGWKSRDFGDPAFVEAKLQNELDRLDKLGEELQAIDSLDGDAINTLFGKAVKDWMEFEYLVSRLRSEYLAERLVNQ